jgi:mono/diheme cytochrome c family protein
MLVPAAGAGGLAACSQTGAVSLDDGGTPDATTDSGISGMDATEEAEQEASCAVDAGPYSDAEVALGLQLVGLHKCENCHGSTLEGNNDGVPSLTVEGGLAYPPNLTPDPGTGLGCWTDDQIENAILNGIDNMGMPLCPPMPRFGHEGDAGLDQAQAAAVVAYLRSLTPTVNNVPNTPNCPQPTVPEAGPEAGPEASTEAGTDASSEASSDASTEASSDSSTEDAPADAGSDVTSSADAGDASPIGDGSVEAGD